MTSDYLQLLKDERDRLERAIAALEGGRAGRSYSPRNAANGRRKGGKRKLSAAAKKRIGAAMKKAWAERKRAAKAA